MSKQDRTDACDSSPAKDLAACAEGRAADAVRDDCTISQMPEPRFSVMLDSVVFDHKPEDSEIGAITRRLQKMHPTALTASELCDAVGRGQTFVCGCYEPTDGKSWGEFTGQQIFALDFDNAREITDKHGKKRKVPLWGCEVGYLAPDEAVHRACDLGMPPILCYLTFHGSLKRLPEFDREWLRYRLVFDNGEPVADLGEAERNIRYLLDCFPEADQVCSNANHLFFGTSGKDRVSVFLGGAWQCLG